MKRAIIATAILFSISVIPCHAQTTKHYSTNQIIAARSKYPLGQSGCIATNTLEYEDYALHWMLTQANEIREKWKLELQQPLAVDNILFQLNATAFGIYGTVCTKDGRFHWVFRDNRFHAFKDTHYAPISFRYKDDVSEKLAKIKSKIAAKEAVEIARNALHQLGYTEQQLKIRKKPEVNQYKFQESDGKIYPLPAFRVTWRKEGKRQLSGGNVEYAPVTIEVSGITCNVSEFWAWEAIQRFNWVIPPALPPTNYLEMLHLPANFFETLPEHKRPRYSPPLPTNVPAKAGK